MSALASSFIPELGAPCRGKVRDIYDGEQALMMIASDRISVFDRTLNEPIQGKGNVLTELSRYWFDQTSDLILNHMESMPDPRVMIVKKCRPLMVEVIVRGYLVGSLWRDYQAGKREKCGEPIPDGLKENDPLPQPLLTPTTKSQGGHDEDITKKELIDQKIVTKDHWEEIASIAFKLFERGRAILKERGVILVDTKYEFGVDAEGKLRLIDEIHTPDSSRFWFQEDVAIQELRFPDKEFVRQWARSIGFTGEGKVPPIPEAMQKKIKEEYAKVFRKITGKSPQQEAASTGTMVVRNLKRAGLIRGKFVLILAGSEKDQLHIDKIEATLSEAGIPQRTIVASAHKHPAKVAQLIAEYNASLEPIVCITVAGRSNALSGVVAANLRWPVIACPPFKDHADYLTNIHSSLQMPSLVPVMTVVDPKNSALAAARILQTMNVDL